MIQFLDDDVFRDKLYDVITDAFVEFQSEHCLPSGGFPFTDDCNIEKAVDNLCRQVSAGIRKYYIEIGGEL